MNPDFPDSTLPGGDPLAGMNLKGALAAGLQHQPWEPPLPADLAAVLTDYEIIDVIGRGGMGAIYKARDPHLDRLVAIKLLPPELSGRPDLVERFTREARALARLDHPNIVKVYDFSHTSAGHLYFVMEYVDGLDLGRILSARGKAIPQREHGATLEIIGHICDALQYAHNKGIVHRDIKPANVLISKDGQVKVADFGLARAIDPGDGSSGFQGAEAMTVSGVVMGTLEYMAPEQRDGQRVDHRADIYAVGVLFYQMLTGQLPRGAFQPPSRKSGTSDVRLDKVVLKALQTEPAERYQHASEVRDAVQALGKLKTPVPAKAVRPVPVQDPVLRPASSGRFPRLVVIVLVPALLLVLLGYLAFRIMEFQKERDAGLVTAALRLPATLAFGSITEKGKPEVCPEAFFSVIFDGIPISSAPILSKDTIPFMLTDAQRQSGKALFLKVSAPNYLHSSLIPINASSQNSFSVPPIELVPEAVPDPPMLPETITFSKLSPESGITLLFGTSSVPVVPGKPIPLSSFGAFDATKSLTVTVAAPGYESTNIEIEPGGRPPPNLSLEPVLAPFSWMSDPPQWFKAACLTRLNAPQDPRLTLVSEIAPTLGKVPVGRYGLSGVWGTTTIPLGEVVVRPGSNGTVLKSPFAEKTQWTAVMDLNPQAVLSDRPATSST